MKNTKRCFLICFLTALMLCAATPVAVSASTKTISVTMKKAYKTKKKTARVGDTVELKLKYKNTLLMNEYVKIRSSKPAVASVGENGEITAKKTGITIITAKFKKRVARIRLTVKAAKANKAAAAAADNSANSIPEDVVLFDSEESVPETTTAEKALPVGTTQSSVRSRMVEYAEKFVGVLPYVYAGNSLTSGTDCSGFIHLIYKHFGLSAPRSASEFQAMSNISYKDLRPGDIIVYKYGGHVALFIGDDMIIHAKGSNYGTVKEKMWYGTPTGYVRIIKD